MSITMTTVILFAVFGVLLSALLLREGQQAFTPYSLAALVLVCVGIFVVNRSDMPGKGM